MERTCCPPGQAHIWGIFLLVLGIGWILQVAGLVDWSIWQYAGPLAILAVAVTMLWPRKSA